MTNSLVRIPSLKTTTEFRSHVASLGIDLPCDDAIATGPASALTQSIDSILVNGKRVGNRFAVQPMEGWDGTATGGITDDVRRRWRRFGESGAKLICGGEAMAVRPDGRANPHQLVISEPNKRDLSELVEILVGAHHERHGTTEDLVIGFQLTHSGRFCKPTDKFRMEPRVAYRHPILDRKFNVTSDAQVWTDNEIERLVDDYVAAARIARDAGADFVDLKHCHGYLLHEFLSAVTRPGRYGGSFENRTRILRDVVTGVRADGNLIDLGVRLSAFDLVPFRPDPALTQPGKPGPGIPEDFSDCLPYRYAFAINPENPVEHDLAETLQFAELCMQLGVKILNLTAGSPYYNPHVQRPAAYPPSDGYLPPEDPLVGVARQIQVVRQVKAHLAGIEACRREVDAAASPNPADQAADAASPSSSGPIVIGSAYSYLQEYLPHVAQSVVRQGWTDMIGLGRMILSYPEVLSDAIRKGQLEKKQICRTFSDCTTAPRNGLISGCYPLDRHYSNKPEFQKLKAIKKSG